MSLTFPNSNLVPLQYPVPDMPRRTSPRDALLIETAEDLDDVVKDKREGWRANSAKARRRQRRYKKRMTDEIAKTVLGDRTYSTSVTKDYE